jgi:hypothetical protein
MTTSLKLSKDLAAIGFSPLDDETIFFYDKNGNLSYDQVGIYLTRQQQDEAILSYDLETMLKALPKYIRPKRNASFSLQFDIVEGFIYYTMQPLFMVKKSKNESLADTAARLLIKLVEKGIINFNKSLS